MEIQKLIDAINTKDKDRNLVGSSFRYVADRAIQTNDEEMKLNLSVSSELPIEDFFGYLILDHKPESIILSRFLDGASFRDTHFGDQVGIIENPTIDNEQKKLRVDVKFSPNNDRAIMLYKDYRDGYRKNVSIRFIVHELVLDKQVNGIDYYRATKWEPVHASAEPDGADPTVGINRSLTTNNSIIKTKGVTMEERTLTADELKGIAEKVKDMVSAEYKTAVDHALQNGGEKEIDRIGAILTSAREFKDQVKGIDLEKEAYNFAFKLKASDRDFRDLITKNIISQQSLNNNTLGASKKDVERFSFRNLILSQVPNSGVKAEHELEMCRAYQEKYDVKAQGIVVPMDVLLRDRTLTTTSVSAGGAVVGTDLLPSNFIEMARNKTVADKVGVQFLGGLQGNVLIPKQSGAGTFSWVTETNAATASDATFAQVSLSPKLGTSNTGFSRKLLFQSTPAIDQLIENDLAKITAIGMDLAVFHGSGASGQPTGIANTSGIGGGALLAAITFADVVALETAVANANLDASTMYYVTNPTVRGLLKTRAKVSGYPNFILEGNEANGYPVVASNQIASGNLFFGDFSQAILAQWGGLDLVVDPYSNATSGVIKVTVFIYVDVGVRYAGAFALNTGVS